MKVQCRCGKEYQTDGVTVFARYSDCSMWKCPSCGVLCDDRAWVAQPYREIRAPHFHFNDFGELAINCHQAKSGELHVTDK